MEKKTTPVLLSLPIPAGFGGLYIYTPGNTPGGSLLLTHAQIRTPRRTWLPVTFIELGKVYIRRKLK